MLAVSLDEAWGDNATNSSEAASPRPSPGAPRPASPRPSRSHDDLAVCVESLQNVSAELRDLKALFARQQNEQRMVVYVSIGVVVLLLMFTAHSYARLQYASECMTWRR